MESALKQMRTMWMFFLVAAFAYIALAEFLPHSLPPIRPVIYSVMLGVALMDLAVIVIMRRFYLGKAAKVLRANPNDPMAIFRWRQGQLAIMGLASAIVLYGLVIRFIGATSWQAVPLYTLGVGATLIFQPKEIQ